MSQVVQSEMIEQVCQVVIEIMSTMAMVESVFVGVESRDTFFLSNEATGLVRLSGSHDGMLGVCTSQAVLRVVMSNLVGMDVDAVGSDDLMDGIAELANMISGSFKARARLGGMHLSSPVAILGKEYVATWKTSQPTQILTFQLSEGTLQVSVSL